MRRQVCGRRMVSSLFFPWKGCCSVLTGYRIGRVLESLKAGRRLPEAGFSNLKMAPSGQSSVYGLYSRRAGGIRGGASSS